MLRSIALLLLLLSAGQACAHASRARSANPSGLAMPGLSHGEMAVLAEYRRDIHKLAATVTRTDPTFRTLLNYGAIQYAYCLWGLAPAAVSDEASPFNECSHAYLSADKALLLHMRGMANAPPGVDALVSEIDAVMVQRGAAFIGCQYSGETFDSAEFLTPHWENVAAHRPSLAAGIFCGLLITAPFGAWASTTIARRKAAIRP